MNTILEQARLLYDIFTFNFEIESTNRSLGEFIPEELFQDILHWVSLDDRTDEAKERLQALYPDPSKRPQDYNGLEAVAVHEARPSYTLKSCALVCRWWARQSRRYMFKGKIIKISTLEDAQSFREYAVNGSSKLFKVCELISGIHVTERFEGSRSHLNLLHLPETREKLVQLRVIGPTPTRIPPLKLDTPHWGISNAVALSPAVTAYKTVSLYRLTFPSYRYLVKYFQHFRAAHHIRLNSLEWHDKVQPPLQRPIPVLRKRDEVFVSAVDCTDGFLVGWQVITMYADSFVHGIVDRDQQWALNIMLFLRDYYEQLDVPDHSCYYAFKNGLNDISQLRVSVARGLSYPTTEITFLHSMSTLSPALTSRGSPRPMRIAGVLCHFDVSNNTMEELPMKYNTPDLTLLRADIEGRCALRVVVFSFNSYVALETIVENHPNLQKPWPRACVYHFACPYLGYPTVIPEVEGLNAGVTYIGIDPVTLEATGQYWSGSHKIVPAYLRSVSA